jgi:ADP-ribose pyrophosphatase
MSDSNPWKKIDSQDVYRNEIGHGVRIDRVIAPNGKEWKYFVLDCKDNATIVAITKDGKVLMEKLWRYPLEQEVLELPVGGIEKDEDALEAAKRELFEETGGRSEKWFELGWHWTDSGFSPVKGNIFLALEVEMEDFVNPDEIEKIKVELYDFDKVVEMVLRNEINDSRTKMGILLADNFLKKNFK